MANPTTSIGFSPTTPAPDNGFQNAVPRGDGGTPLMRESFEVPNTGGVNAKTTSYTAVAADCGKIISFNSASAVTLTLPSTVPFGQWAIFVQNLGAGVLTVTPGGSTHLDGGTSGITLAQNTGGLIQADGTNYFFPRPPQADGTSIIESAGVLSTTGSAAVKALYTGNNANGGTNSGGSPSSGSFTTSKGNTVLVFAAFNGTPSGVAFTDTQGNTYQLVAHYASGNDEYVYAALNVAGGTGNVITGTASGVTFWGFQAMEYTNVVGASPLDASGTAFGVGVPVTASVTTANASDALISFGYVLGGGGWTYSWTNSFVQELTSAPASGINMAVADLNVSALGTYSTAFSRSSGGSATSYHLLIALRVGTGVQDFNGRTGHVALQAGDVSAVGGVTSLTAIGTSGAATLSSGVLNVPNYTAGGTSAVIQIAKTVLSSAASNIAFSSIPGIYSQLQLVVVGATSSGSADEFAIQFNGDTGTNYNYAGVFNNGSSPGAYTGSSVNHIQFAGNVPPPSATNQASHLVITISLYAGTTFLKTAQGVNSNENGYTGVSGGWNSTAAITSIKIFLVSGSNLVAGSTAILYGIL